MKNEYIPIRSEIKAIKKHTDIEYTFTMEYKGEVSPGQFFQVSIPKFGEAPISVSGIGEDTIDFTIRKVGKVTNEIFENYVGEKLFIRGPYGRGFEISDYKGREIAIVAGGTGFSPVRGVVEYFVKNPSEAKSVTLIVGFKSPEYILFKEDLEAWKDRINIVLTVDNASDSYTGNVGLVTKFIPEIKFEDINNVSVICVGPPMMMKYALMEIERLGVLDSNIWISHERKMCCGIGKCGHCKIDDKYVCLDGPVFNYTVGKNLID